MEDSLRLSPCRYQIFAEYVNREVMCLTHVNCRRRQQKTLRFVATFSNPRLLEKIQSSLSLKKCKNCKKYCQKIGIVKKLSENNVKK